MVNFANAVDIVTANLPRRNTNENFDEELKRRFRPESFDRADAVVVFKNLTTSQIRQIVNLRIALLARDWPTRR